jgi:two-component system chemotaxis response regulator CheB
MVKKIIVIGASAGGFKALTQLIQNVPADIPVAICVVIHLAENSLATVLIKHLEKHTSFRCRIPKDNERIEEGHLYLAPPDYHMLIKPGVIKLVRGAQENRWRPSIDVLFRSAAVAYNSRLIGIVLSGMLDDGTSGMSVIKRCGGVCIVQEPSEAEFNDMPVNVLNHVEVDYRIPVADIGYIIADVVSMPVADHEIPGDIQIEADITERMVSSITEMASIGEHSNYACPDCGGNLWELKDKKVSRYRCHTGHTYTEDLLLKIQNEKIEESIWVSIRMLEERRNLLVNIANTETTSKHLKERYKERSDYLDNHIKALKKLLSLLNTEAGSDNAHQV